MTLSFHKVMFSAEEVLDILQDCETDNENFEDTFVALAEERSRLPELQETWVKRNG